MRISSFLVIVLCAGLTRAACTTAEGGGEERQWTVDAGALKLRVSEDPWNMTFFDAAGSAVLVELPSMDEGPSGSLGMHLGSPPPGDGQHASLPRLDDGHPSTPPSRDAGWVTRRGRNHRPMKAGTLRVSGC